MERPPLHMQIGLRLAARSAMFPDDLNSIAIASDYLEDVNPHEKGGIEISEILLALHIVP